MALINKEDVERLVAAASPHDGFQLRETIVGEEHSLHICFYLNGQPAPLPWRTDRSLCQEVWAKKNPTDVDFGEKARLRLLLQALCRFVNTGGEWSQLEATMGSLWHMCRGEVKVDIPGFHLIDSCINSEGAAEHIFADGGKYGIRWAEGQFFDVLSMTDLIIESNHEEEGNSAPEGANKYPALEAGVQHKKGDGRSKKTDR